MCANPVYYKNAEICETLNEKKYTMLNMYVLLFSVLFTSVLCSVKEEAENSKVEGHIKGKYSAFDVCILYLSRLGNKAM